MLTTTKYLPNIFNKECNTSLHDKKCYMILNGIGNIFVPDLNQVLTRFKSRHIAINKTSLLSKGLKARTISRLTEHWRSHWVLTTMASCRGNGGKFSLQRHRKVEVMRFHLWWTFSHFIKRLKRSMEEIIS